MLRQSAQPIQSDQPIYTAQLSSADSSYPQKCLT